MKKLIALLPVLMLIGTDIPWEYGRRAHVGATAWLAFA
jgi:hypothetical protein